METILRFGCLETTLDNPRSYGDPYRDVELVGKFTNAYGQTRAVRGFYDGACRWRVRFRADVPGKWWYEATFSDGAAGAQGDFMVLSREERFAPVQINPANPIWFRRGVAPFYPRAFHAGDRFFAANWPAPERLRFLDWLQAQGYNTLSIASHLLNRNVAGRGRGWETPRLWPLDAAEYRKLEAVLDELDRRGIVVFPFAGFIGKDSDYPRTPADQDRFVRYTMARLGYRGNLWYNVAGPEPNLKDHWLPPEVVTRLGRLVRDEDPYAHPLTVHNRTGDDDHRDSDWTTFGTLQGPKTRDRTRLAAGLLRNHHPAKPLFAQETLWSGNRFHIAANGGDYTDDDLRKHTFVIAMCGAGFCFADNAGDSSSGFSGTLDLADCAGHRHAAIAAAWDCFLSFPWFALRPAPELISRGWCLAQPGRRYLAYQETPGSFALRLEGGPFRATWVNPREPADRRTAGLVTGGDFTTPDGDDWLLWLDTEGTGLPEQVHLSWQEDPATSMTATWHTPSSDNPATMAIRAVDGGDWKEATGSSCPSPGGGWLHRVTVRGLQPDTAYAYRLSGDRGLAPAMGAPRTTRTAPTEAGTVRFAVITDTGIAGRLDGNAAGVEAVMDALLADAPLFVLGCGDYAYANRDGRFATVGQAVDAWFRQYEPVISRHPFMTQYGNHETRLIERFEDWAPRLAHPEGFQHSRCYAFDVGAAHFAGMFLVDAPPSAEELAWLDADLRRARAQGRAWVIVFQHEPVYGFGRSHPSKPGLVRDLIPILERHGADLVLSGHDQNYERTYPLSGPPEGPRVMSDSLETYAAGEGVLYCKVSPAGKQSEIGNTYSRFTVPQQPFMAVRDDTACHYALVTVRAARELQLEAFAVPTDGSPKLCIDRFTIRRPGQSPAP